MYFNRLTNDEQTDEHTLECQCIATRSETARWVGELVWFNTSSVHGSRALKAFKQGEGERGENSEVGHVTLDVMTE
jgi:hypothetical protein